jgi:prolyl-tRNA synthetase
MNDNTIIIPRSKSFSEWYESIVINAKLATHANVKGCINYLPYG